MLQRGGSQPTSDRSAGGAAVGGAGVDGTRHRLEVVSTSDGLRAVDVDRRPDRDQGHHPEKEP